MIIPLWSILGLGAAILAAAMMLAQEHLKVSGFALAFWNKVFSAVIMIWPTVYFGLPEPSHYYIYLFMLSVVYAISDVIFFDVVSKTGAGTLSRIMPLGLIATFCLWLVFDPVLLHKYLDNPLHSGAIFACIAGAAYFGFALKKCAFSWGVLKAAWFVIVAGIMGNIIAKLMTQGVDPLKAAFASVSIASIMMVVIWSVYYALRRPVPMAEMISKKMLKSGAIIGLISSSMVAMLLSSVLFAENPAYTSALFHLSSVCIIFYYKIRGIEDRGDVKAGMGIVFCAVALIMLKSF